jgi:hypothetical protein
MNSNRTGCWNINCRRSIYCYPYYYFSIIFPKYPSGAVRCAYSTSLGINNATHPSDKTRYKALIRRPNPHHGRHVLIPSPHIIPGQNKTASIPILPIKSCFKFLEYSPSMSKSWKFRNSSAQAPLYSKEGINNRKKFIAPHPMVLHSDSQGSAELMKWRRWCIDNI